ncbi:hypothetical protein KY290_034105 [Solanum tuberosum]|uniref:Uncharacterized protein n=1 Tax=Solanum tuberosum TaxID=4113 RepID=A0ABQ7U490_SOLTU|nr:hypothetical protein KY289_033497 [Solanum tuberosum]KAH0741062.1 hypothetical protein KY290_034105 [Solanum tuberosum]
MLDKYDLADNSWLKTTFAIREKWSMTYGRNTFSAGHDRRKLSSIVSFSVVSRIFI